MGLLGTDDLGMCWLMVVSLDYPIIQKKTCMRWMDHGMMVFLMLLKKFEHFI